MARQQSFGEALRRARERKGLDLSTAARKLRIRPDILRAIEESDFARMPPRGYTSNMVGAYARLVGLNPTEITRAYRDEAYQFETGSRPVSNRDSRTRSYDRGTNRAGMGGSSRSRGDLGGSRGRTSSMLEPRVSGGSTVGEINQNRSPRSNRSSRGQRTGTSAAPLTNFMGGNQGGGLLANLQNYLPMIIVAAVIVGLLILVLVLAFGNKGAEQEETPTIPISGMPQPTASEDGTGEETPPSKAPVAPTSVKFTFKVADGQSAYIEVYENGDSPSIAEEVEGPSTEEFNVTGTLRFVTTNPEAVTLELDGEAVEPEDSNGSGVYSYTVDFDEYLDDWEKDNGVDGSSSKSSSKNAKSSSSKNSTTSDEDGADSSDSTDSSDEDSSEE